MAEPQIGMSFLTYKAAFNAKSDKGRYNVWTNTSVEYNGSSARASAVYAGEVGNSKTELRFVGYTEKYLEKGDVKFTEIYGDKYMAIDNNRNGVVDKDEIFEIKK